MDIPNNKGNKPRVMHKIQEDKFKKKSEMLQRERDNDITDVAEIINMFWDIHFLRKPDQSVEPFDPSRIETHVRLKGETLSPWTYTLLMEMDLVFRATIISMRE